MKKNYLYLLAFATLSISCVRETDHDILAPDITAIAEIQPETKSVLSVDKAGTGTIYWSPSDQIDVFFGTTKVLYTSQNSDLAETAVFKTQTFVSSSDLESTNIWGLFPSNENTRCDGSSVTTALPAAQYGVRDTFDDHLFITLAHSNSTSLQFYNVCSGIKFSLTRDDIKTIRFSGNNGEDLAGEINITVENGFPKATVVNGVKEITLMPKDGDTFAQGVNYYIVTLPGTLSQGFTMEFTTEKGSTGVFRYTDSEITLKRSIFSRKGSIDRFADFPDIPVPVPEAIDLGLSVKWASFNLGASKPEEYGYYYSWGETRPKTDYSWDTYKWGYPPSKYNASDGLTTLEAEDDAVRATLKGNWRMPTTEEDEELYLKCTREYTRVNGINGYRFTGPNGNSIFIPSAGIYDGDSYLSSTNVQGWYWSSGLDTYDLNNARGLFFSSGYFNYGNGSHDRCDGHVIRPVEDDGGATPSEGNNVIYYTSSDGQVVTPFSNGFGANIISNEYKDGRGMITFDGVVTTIGDFAFQHCSTLLSILIPDSVMIIGQYAFFACNSLTDITLPKRLISLDMFSFYLCPELTHIEIPEGLTSLGSYCFGSCKKLASITIPDSVESIGISCFEGCSSLSQFAGKYASTDGRALIKDGAFLAFAPYGLESYTVPQGVTTLSTNCFSDCREITSISISNSVTIIDDGAFRGCSSLTEITLPESLHTLGYECFFNCSSLPSITIPDSVETIQKRCFYGCFSLYQFNGKYATTDGRALIKDGVFLAFAPYGLESYEIPDNVTSLASSCFSGCQEITSIIIPSSVSSIGVHCFHNCSRLSSITIPEGVTVLPLMCFDGCTSLKSIILPKSLEIIADGCFLQCPSLESITIPSQVKEIYYCAFYGCSSLSSVTLEPQSVVALKKSGSLAVGGVDPDALAVFDNTNDCPIYVPGNLVEEYRASSDWAPYADRIQAIPPTE